MRDDDLGVAFRAECTRFEERFLEEDATLVHVETSFDIVERVRDSIEGREEVIVILCCG